VAGYTKPTPQRWAKLAVDYYRNPKIIQSGPYAELAYIRLLAIARERIETSDKDGEVPLVLAERELRDICETMPEKPSVITLLTVLEANNLITLTDTTIMVDDYAKWQTTSKELEVTRATARTRAAAYRSSKKKP